MSYFMGIDPGKSGAWAVINEEGTYVDSCEYISAKSSAGNIRRYNPTLVALEHVHAFPKQGVSGVFAFGQNFGEWQGVLAALSIPHLLVSPIKWQNSIIDIKKAPIESKRKLKDGTVVISKTRDKTASVDFVNRRWPLLKLKKTHSGIADALCLALYARKISTGEG